MTIPRTGIHAFALVVAFAGAALAQNATHGAFFDTAARFAWARGDLRKALQDLLDAYRIAPTAGLAYNVAVTAQASGALELAYDFLMQHRRLVDRSERGRREGDRRPFVASTCDSVWSEGPVDKAASHCEDALRRACAREAPNSEFEPTLCLSSEDSVPRRIRDASLLWATERDVTQRLAQLTRRVALTSVESSPPGALVYLDRKELGELGRTPFVAALPAGRHRLLVEAADHLPGVLEFEATLGQLVPLSVELPRRKGAIHFAPADPETAAVARADDGTEFVLSAHRTTHLPVGRYTIEFTLGDDRQTAVQWVREGPSTEVRFIGMRRPQFGRLLVRTRVAGTRVSLDTVPVGETPLTLNRVPAGVHTLTLATGRTEIRTLNTTVRPGAATLIDLHDAPRPSNGGPAAHPSTKTQP